MTETTNLIVKDDNYYKTLVDLYFKEAKLEGVDSMEKQKFLSLCVVNKLNPFKNQVYAIPRNSKQKDGTWKKILTVTVAYTTYLERAESSGLLSGWNVIIKKEQSKVTGGKIQIYRKDRQHPFEYEADITEYIQDNNPLWLSKPEQMMRKQLIRIGFSLCFPENCASLDSEPEVIDAVKVEEVEIPVIENHGPAIDLSGQGELEKQSEKIDYNVLQSDDPTKIMNHPISKDQIGVIKMLVEYFPGEEIHSPEFYQEAESMIDAMKIKIGEKFIKDRSINLSEQQVNMLFGGDNKAIKAIKKASLKLIEGFKNKK